MYYPHEFSGYKMPLEYCKQLFNFDFWSVLHFLIEFTKRIQIWNDDTENIFILASAGWIIPACRL